MKYISIKIKGSPLKIWRKAHKKCKKTTGSAVDQNGKKIKAVRFIRCNTHGETYFIPAKGGKA